MASIELRGHYECVGSKPASTTKTDVLTCPSAGGVWYIVARINICASGGAAGTADVFQYDSKGAVEYQIQKDAVVPAAGSLSLNDLQIVLLGGDILRVTPSAAAQHVMVYYMVGRSDPQEFVPGLRR